MMLHQTNFYAFCLKLYEYYTSVYAFKVKAILCRGGLGKFSMS